MTNLRLLGKQAKEAAFHLGLLETTEKNRLLLAMASDLEQATKDILLANQKDLLLAEENNVPPTMLDRLRLTEQRILEMAEGIRQVASLPDPIGMVDAMWKNSDGLTIGKQRVPLGVVGIIYESRPNVTTDAASLCFKSGNAVILRGGKEAFYSNQLLIDTLQNTLKKHGMSPFAIQFIDDPSREVAQQFMKLTEYLDVLIPRGGNQLIQTVIETATVPVIETGTGNCHIYIDKNAQLDMSVNILINAKCQRPSVCNAVETLLIHREVSDEFLPIIEEALNEYSVELRADKRSLAIFKTAIPATEEDWSTEFLDYILAVKIVDSLDEAIEHINYYNTKHSESIISDDYFATQKFLHQIDAAAVYVNSSTRFTDGFAFGLGAEIGISTQKLHARGPMGLKELTTIKHIVYGTGQYRK